MPLELPKAVGYGIVFSIEALHLKTKEPRAATGAGFLCDALKLGLFLRQQPSAQCLFTVKNSRPQLGADWPDHLAFPTVQGVFGLPNQLRHLALGQIALEDAIFC
jgi:hypothetical protein